MKSLIKTKYAIDKMRMVGKLAAEVLEMIEFYIQPGISTGELDRICYNYITKKQKAFPSSLGYNGFPKSICTSINEVVCHGIPNYNHKLKDGDILNIDVAIMKDGFHSDTSKMYLVGKHKILGKKLCTITQKSLYLAIQEIKPGVRLRKIGKTIQKFVESKNFSVVKDYCGHGIGNDLHEDPQVLHYNAPDKGLILAPGMVFTIEPMVNLGSQYVKIMKDGWTVKTKDNSLSAQYEHTVAVTEQGYEILTFRSEENFPRNSKF